jgi:hypothetical protein
LNLRHESERVYFLAAYIYFCRYSYSRLRAGLPFYETKTHTMKNIKYYPVQIIGALLLLSLAVPFCRNEPANNATQGLSRIKPVGVEQLHQTGKEVGNLFDGDVKTWWFTGWSAPYRARLDFGREVKITAVRYYDGDGEPELILKRLEGTAGASEASHKLSAWNEWKEQPTDLQGRFFEIVIPHPGGQKPIAELEFYGPSGQVEPPGPDSPPVVTPPPPPPVDTAAPPVPPVAGAHNGDALKIGANIFHWVPIDKLKALGNARMFFSNDWTDRPGGLHVQPLWGAQSQHVKGLDDFLTTCKANGIKVTIAFNQTADWRRARWFQNVPIPQALPAGTLPAYTPKQSLFESFLAYSLGQNPIRTQSAADPGPDYPPIQPGADPTKVESWTAGGYPAYLFQIVARYGSKVHPPHLLKVDPELKYSGEPKQEAKSGLNLITSIEFWNEADKWWNNLLYVNPEGYAAFLIACCRAIYDADPTVGVHMAGITGPDMEYLNRVDVQVRKLNGGVWPVNLKWINFHNYANTGNLEKAPNVARWPPTWLPGGAVAPELDKTMHITAQIVKFAKERGMKAECTEFGYDDVAAPGGVNSWQYPQAVPGVSVEETKARWLVRAYLEYIRYGAEQMNVFNFIDEPGAVNGGLYQSSGLLKGENAGFAEKPAYRAVAELARELEGMTLAADLSTPAVRLLVFKGGGKTKFCYWSPTAENKTQTLKLGGCNLIATEKAQFFTL